MPPVDVPYRPSRVIRKSAYGRTHLFLPEATCLFREVKCMGGIVKRDYAAVYHTLDHTVDTPHCWHCCEPLDSNRRTVIPLPRVYDPVRDEFHVYGGTCSPGCAKAYILEHTTFDRGQHLNVLVKMLRDVYGFTQHVQETPPRPALRRFGGAFDPKAQLRAECRLVEPPFVSYCMLLEERARIAEDLPDSSSSAAPSSSSLLPPVEDTLGEPPLPALFEAFLQEGGERSEERHEAQERRRAIPTLTTPQPSSSLLPAKRKLGKTGTGMMAKFMKGKGGETP